MDNNIMEVINNLKVALLKQQDRINELERKVEELQNLSPEYQEVQAKKSENAKAFM